MAEEFDRFLKVLDQYIGARAKSFLEPGDARRVPLSSTHIAQARRTAVEVKAADLEVCFNRCVVEAVQANFKNNGSLREMLRLDLGADDFREGHNV
ncbi:MAG: hypothetical protein QOJ70_1139 [Acidobacteriota bacterium]|jgi:hypothetical protein|nr:hypothetical protein [Acidobacteriota bacterium]